VRRHPAALAATLAILASVLSVTGTAAQAQAEVLGAPDPVLVGAGDIAVCGRAGDSKTADLVEDIPGTVFTAGDNAYPDGTLGDFEDCYEPTWGAFRARTRPSPGNHDYRTADGSGYFAYFKAAAGDPGKGYYAYDLGAWRIYSLNSNCGEVGGCGAGSPQRKWL
jgi:hypothetical protein